MAKTWKKLATVAIAATIVVPMAACNKNVDETVTYRTYTSVMPSNWNELTYADNNDTQIMNYIVSSFYEYDYEFDEAKGGKFNEDGTIQPVTPTLRGVGVSPARSIIQLDRYSFLSQGGTYIDFLNVENPFEGWFVSLPRPETWVEYEDIDFGSASPKTVKMRVRSEKGAKVAFSAAENQYFAHMDIPASAAWTEVSAPMESELTGLNYVRAVVESGDVQIDWMTFE